MKKHLMLIFAVFLFVGFTDSAHALTYNEEYRGCQIMKEGEGFNFGFDFWGAIDGDTSIGTKNTFDRMWLVNDEVIIPEIWEAAELYIDFYSCDWAWENAGIHFFVLNEYGEEVADFDLGVLKGYLWGSYHYSHIFTQDQLDSFSMYYWGYAEIKAVRTSWCNYNDFMVKKVGMNVLASPETPVPEPATMLMMATGLVGMAGLIRRKPSRRKITEGFSE